MATVEFFSRAWVDALDEAARDWAGPPEVELTLAQVVRTPEGDDVHYHLVIAGGRLTVRPGPAPEASITVSQPAVVAAAIARGELSAQQAFAAGAIKVSGDVGLLSRHGRTLAQLDDVFARVRERTRF